MEVGFWYSVVAAHVSLSLVPKVLNAVDMTFLNRLPIPVFAQQLDSANLAPAVGSVNKAKPFASNACSIRAALRGLVGMRRSQNLICRSSTFRAAPQCLLCQPSEYTSDTKLTAIDEIWCFDVHGRIL